MLVYKITFTLKGQKFSPNLFLERADVKSDFFIFDRNEPNDMIDFDHNYDFGSLSLVRTKICMKNELDIYEKEYLDFFNSNKELINNSIDQIIYTLDVFYSDFCSLELSGTENYSCYMNYNFSIPINVYKCSDAEIVSMLLKNGYGKDYIMEYDW